MSTSQNVQISKIWAVAGGRDTKGKTVVAAGLAFAAARRGRTVVVVDADFSSPSLHKRLGSPSDALSWPDSLDQDGVNINEARSPTSHVRVELLGLGVDPPTRSRTEVASALTKLVPMLRYLDVDIVIVDLGAGRSPEGLDLFAKAHRCILVAAPDPLAVQHTYGYLKAVTYQILFSATAGSDNAAKLLDELWHRPDAYVPSVNRILRRIAGTSPEIAERAKRALMHAHFALVASRAVNAQQGQRIGRALDMVARAFLKRSVRFIGTVPEDDAIKSANEEGMPVYTQKPTARGVRCMDGLVAGLVAEGESFSGQHIAIAHRRHQHMAKGTSETHSRGNTVAQGLSSAGGKLTTSAERTGSQPAISRDPEAAAEISRSGSPPPPHPADPRSSTTSHGVDSVEIGRGGPNSGDIEDSDRTPRWANPSGQTSGARRQLGKADKLQVEGRVYHVQTEDLGRSAAVIQTMVYEGGHIFATVQASYALHLDRVDLALRIQQLAAQQHRDTIDQLKRGALEPGEQKNAMSIEGKL